MTLGLRMTCRLLTVSCCLIGCVMSFSVVMNRSPPPRNRWARMMDDNDGWEASAGPFAVHSQADVVDHHHQQQQQQQQPSESLYEVSVGRRSSLTSNPAATISGSPDVIIGRVVQTPSEEVDAAAASVAVAAAAVSSTPAEGQSHQFQPINVPVGDQDLPPRSNDEQDQLHLAQDRKGDEDELVKKSDQPILPPGSFFLPAVSRKEDEYYSDDEQAIYIPLHRPETSGPLYPVRTQVVLVTPNQNGPPASRLVSPVANPAVLHDKEDDEEEEEEDEEEEEEDDEHIEEENNNVVNKNPLDLVMTVYPNLPKFLPPSQLVNSGNHHGVKSTTFFHHQQQPVKPAMSVIHEVKVVTPPHGYLPSLSSKPKSHIGPAGGNDPLTHLKLPGTKPGSPAAVSPSVHHTVHHQHQVSSPPKYTPFTSDDISPLNFIAPPVGGPTTERIAVDHQHLHQPHRDQIVEQSVHVPLPYVNPKAMDFRWNISAPPSNWFGRLPPSPPSPPPAEVQQPDQHQPDGSTAQLVVPGDTSEVIVRTKMATAFSPSSSYSVDTSSSPSDTIEIITGYFSDSSAPDDIKPLVKYNFQPSFFSQPIVSPPAAPSPSESASSASSINDSYTPPKLHGEFQPMAHDHHADEHPQFMKEVPAPVLAPVKTQDGEDDVFGVPRSPDLFDDQHVADSQIHETAAYEENLPQVIPLKPGEEAGAIFKSSTPHYKPGKLSPKGAMYTINQGHSKVKFFGFNALHGSTELMYPDGKYLFFHDPQQTAEAGWMKFSPYLPVRVPHPNSSSVKSVPKKSIPVNKPGTTTIRPVFFAKRPPSEVAATHVSPSGPGISDPFEYHAHLQKMAEDRLPSQPPPS